MYDVDYMVAHNYTFDMMMIIAESCRNIDAIKTISPHLWDTRRTFTDMMKTSRRYCTMKYGRDICKIEKSRINGNIYYKNPKLIELYTTLFNETPNNLHNSLVDVMVCLRCFVKMKLKYDIMDKNSDFKRKFTLLCYN